MINNILRQWIDNRVAIIYLDNILNFAKTQSKYVARVCSVLQMLWENKLFLKPKKCKFFKDKIEYLGLIISHNHIEMDLIKVNGVRDWPCPHNVKEVQLFLRFVSFYHCFIQDFTKIACPLNDPTWKDMAFQWMSSKDSMFKTLKSWITSAPVLMFPSEYGHFWIEADMSSFATRAVLSWMQEDEKWHPVAFLS